MLCVNSLISNATISGASAMCCALSILSFLARLGIFGPLLLEALDTSFFYLPFANEILLITLITSGERRLWWIVYAISSAIGSVIGTAIFDSMMRKAGEEGLEKFVSSKKSKRIKSKLEKHVGKTVFLASLMPPPFPFRIAVAAAAALQGSRKKILLGVFTGRLVRFAAESLLILYFGKQLLRMVESEAFRYLVYALMIAAIAGSVITIRKWLGKGRSNNQG